MRIAITGAGNVGGGQTRAAVAAGHDAFLDITLNATKGWAGQSAAQLVGPTA